MPSAEGSHGGILCRCKLQRLPWMQSNCPFADKSILVDQESLSNLTIWPHLGASCPAARLLGSPPSFQQILLTAAGVGVRLVMGRVTVRMGPLHTMLDFRD